MEEGNVNVNARWLMPAKGKLKCNVRSYFTPEPLPNGNLIGIGVVFRNSLGIIVHMAAGSLGFEDQRENQFNAFLEGMKEAFYKDYSNIILETDEADPYWEWYNSTVVGGQPQYEFILQQLNQRRADKNFLTEVRLVDREDNMLAAYLAEYGAQNWKQMLIIEEPFGRVEELWHYDMGLGYFGPRFRAVYQGEVNHAALADEVVDPHRDNNAQNENEEIQMMDGNEQNGIEVLAAAAVNQNDMIGNDLLEDNPEGMEVQEMPNMEIVIGLAAVPEPGALQDE